MKKLTINEFVHESNIIHNNKYNYSKAIYKNSQTKIEIICPVHGSFFQLPNNHKIQKRGCRTCSTIKASKSQKISNSDFIKTASKKHNNFYTYEKSIYINYHTKIKITCPLHSFFWQEPASHLNGCGCPQCKYNKFKNERIKSISQFITDANNIHNFKYYYNKSIYSGAFKKLIISCKNHGDFLQTPTNHLTGKGCPNCGYNISIPEIEFLNYMNLKKEYHHKYIKPYIVDGYDPETNTIYEFLGDYWHGNPDKHNPMNIHPRTKITFGEIYKNTFNRLNKLKSFGYDVKYIWETDWNKFKKRIDKTPNILSI